jgi:hypothetical protein
MISESSVEHASSISAGSSLCIVAEFETGPIGASASGARGKLAEQVGEFLIGLRPTRARMKIQFLPLTREKEGLP